MTRLRQSTRRKALLSTPVEFYQVDGVALSEEEVNLAKLLIDKLARTEKNRPIDFTLASKWKLQQSRPTKN
jgi:hypothetical protein